MIPQSSASLEGVAPNNSDPVKASTVSPQLTLNPRSTLTVPTKLKLSSADLAPIKPLVQLAHSFVSGSAK